MSATNLDLPVLIAPEQIRRREFVTIRRGYDPDQVRDYLEQLAEQAELMQSLLREARAEAQAAARASEQPRIDPYEELARRVSGVIREADAAAEKIRSGATRDAERTTGEARADADRIRTDAQARAEETRAAAEAAAEHARAEADRTISGLAERRDALVGQLASMQERLTAVARDLEQTIQIEGPEPPAAVEVPPAPADELAPADDAPATEHGPAGEHAPADDAQAFASEDVADATSAPGADERVIDVTDRASAEATGHGQELFAEFDDPAYEELWEGTQSMRLEMPEIPPLDLDWGDEDDDVDDLRD